MICSGPSLDGNECPHSVNFAEALKRFQELPSQVMITLNGLQFEKINMVEVLELCLFHRIQIPSLPGIPGCIEQLGSIKSPKASTL
jgi:hypothetical protein